MKTEQIKVELTVDTIDYVSAIEEYNEFLKEANIESLSCQLKGDIEHLRVNILFLAIFWFISVWVAILWGHEWEARGYPYSQLSSLAVLGVWFWIIGRSCIRDTRNIVASVLEKRKKLKEVKGE